MYGERRSCALLVFTGPPFDSLDLTGTEETLRWSNHEENGPTILVSAGANV